jgi:hypothetical protein
MIMTLDDTSMFLKNRYYMFWHSLMAHDNLQFSTPDVRRLLFSLWLYVEMIRVDVDYLFGEEPAQE